MTEDVIIKVCTKHGNLTEEQCYYRKNREKYECRSCMRESEKNRPKREYTGAFAEYHRAHSKEWRRQNAESLNEKIREDRKNNPEKYREWERNKRYQNISKYRYRDVLKKHKITADQYEKIWDKHKGLCAICFKEETRISRNGVTTTRICLDHCHICDDNGYDGIDTIRGMLCGACNKGIGLLEDNPEYLLRAITYLQQHEHIMDDVTGVNHE
jgi:hypothetical protein